MELNLSTSVIFVCVVAGEKFPVGCHENGLSYKNQ